MNMSASNSVIVGLVFGIIVYCGMLAAEAKDRAPVGWVESYAGARDWYKIARQGKEHDLAIYSPLFYGDKVLIINPRGILGIQYINGISELVVSEKSPHSIEEEVDGGSLNFEILQRIGKIITWWWSSEPRKVNLGVREWPDNRSLGVPILAHGPQLVVAGDRAFLLSWTGGTAPYSVTIRTANASKIALVIENIGSRHLGPVNIHFDAAIYDLEIKDKSGNAAVGQIRGVTRDTLPSFPGLPDRDRLPADVHTTLFSTLLAMYGEGQWVLEAYLQSSSVAKSHPPARVLRSALSDGLRPTFD